MDQSSAPFAPGVLANQSPSHWGKWLLAKNPFYLASVGLLLYGVDKFTSILALASPSAGQWIFHLGALFVYGLMLVITAIFLARRSIWYDAILLVVLENLFILVPFSVVSRLVLADSLLANVVSCTWVFFVAAKFWALRRYIPELKLPRQFLILGNLFALVNAVWPLLFHSLESQRETLHNGLIVSWLLVLPLLAGAVFLLPKPDFSRTSPAKQWTLFPMLFGLWLMVTACHLGGLGYVHTFNWEIALLAPTIWVLAWAIHFRLDDVCRNAPKALQHGTLCLPVAALLLSVAQDHLFLILTISNAAIYAVLYFRQRDALRLHLLLVSVAAIFAALPASSLNVLIPDLRQEDCVFIAAAIYCMLSSLLSKNPKLGLLGALVVVFATACFRHGSGPLHEAIQMGMLFMLLHSLRWEDDHHEGASLGRRFIAVAWILHSVIWLVANERTAVPWTITVAAILLAAYFIAWFIFRIWKPAIIPASAAAVLMSYPVIYIFSAAKKFPASIWAILGAFVLFAAGTALALTKHRWNKTEGPDGIATQIDKTSL